MRRRRGGSIGFLNSQSVLLDGSDEFINIDGVCTALAGDSVGAWMCWVKPADISPAATEYFITLGDANANTRIQLHITSTSVLRITLVNNGTTGYVLSTDAIPFVQDEWVHICVTHNATRPFLLVNGVQVAQTFTVDNDRTEWVGSLAGLDTGRIGGSNFNSAGEAGHYNGNVDDIVIFDAFLTDGEVAEAYNDKKGFDYASHSKVDNIIAWFKIDEDIISTCVDHISTLDGTYVNVEQADIEFDTFTQ